MQGAGHRGPIRFLTATYEIVRLDCCRMRLFAPSDRPGWLSVARFPAVARSRRSGADR